MKMKNLISIILFAFSLTQSPSVFTIPIHGDIDMGLPYYIQRGIEMAEENDAAYILFDIDTFGGRLDAATRIKDAILGTSIPTIAFINRRAISAGALISLSCDSVYMTSGATIGAATAVDQSGKKASEKVISYMREEMASTAEANGRNRDVAAAMVDEEIEISYVVDVRGDTLTDDQVSGFKMDKLITLSTDLAIRLGIADREIENKQQLLEHLLPEGYKEVMIESTWSEKMVRFFTGPTVAPLLMSLGLLGLFIEIRTPGFGFPGIFGLICLGLFFGSHLLVGLADIFEILLLVAGIALILAEIFVVPGFGITGISGILLTVYSLYKMLLSPNPAPGEAIGAFYSLNIMLVSIIVLGFVFFKAITRSSLYKKLVPVMTESREEGYTVSSGYEKLSGKTGKAITDLRPSGKAVIEGKEYQVLSHGEYIEKGSSVVVDGVDANQITVRRNLSIAEDPVDSPENIEKT